MQFLEDTNTGMLDLFEQPAHHEPKVFFNARADITYKVVEETVDEKRAEWHLIPRDEMRPRLQQKMEKWYRGLGKNQSKLIESVTSSDRHLA